MAKESGLRQQRVEHGTEGSGGTVDADLIPFASVVNSVEWTPDKSTDERRGIGNVDPVEFENGMETHEIVVNHDLEGTIGTHTADGTADSNPVVREAMVRNSDNKIENERTFIHREKHNSGGTESAGVRYYTVARHCKPNVTLSGDSESGAPIEAEVTLNAEKARKYEIHQPSTANSLSVNTTAGDTGSVTLEDDNGTKTSVAIGSDTGATSYSSLDAVWCEGTFDGDITVEDGGTTLVTIKGANSYGSIEGDRGIPAVPDSGTRITDFSGSANKFLGSPVNWQGSQVAPELENVEFSVENNYENYPRHDQFGQTVEEGNRNLTFSASVIGPSQSKDKIMAYLQQDAGTFSWQLGASTIDVSGAHITDPGSDMKEEGQVFAVMDNEFTGTGISIS